MEKWNMQPPAPVDEEMDNVLGLRKGDQVTQQTRTFYHKLMHLNILQKPRLCATHKAFHNCRACTI